jgi:hypothetical protein
MSFLVSRRSLSDKKEKENSPFEGKTKSTFTTLQTVRENPRGPESWKVSTCPPLDVV